jgi:DNA repair protein RadC
MKNLYEYSLSRQYVGKVAEEATTYTIQAPDSAREVLEAIGIHNDEQENFVCLHLDTQNKVKGFQKVTKGLIDRSHVHPREVFRAAIISGSAKVILSHNHPSGILQPSSQDLACTENLIEAGEILGIKVIDHIICGENFGKYEQISMRSQGIVNFK